MATIDADFIAKIERKTRQHEILGAFKDLGITSNDFFYTDTRIRLAGIGDGQKFKMVVQLIEESRRKRDEVSIEQEGKKKKAFHEVEILAEVNFDTFKAPISLHDVYNIIEENRHLFEARSTVEAYLKTMGKTQETCEHLLNYAFPYKKQMSGVVFTPSKEILLVQKSGELCVPSMPLNPSDNRQAIFEKAWKNAANITLRNINVGERAGATVSSDTIRTIFHLAVAEIGFSSIEDYKRNKAIIPMTMERAMTCFDVEGDSKKIIAAVLNVKRHPA